MAEPDALLEKTRSLSPELRQEVEDFVDFVTRPRGNAHGQPLRQDWAGALEHLRDDYTSLELQKQALEWRDQ